jgi:hypothetical protein
MTTIRVDGVYFRVYPGDHEPRHVHGEYAESIAIVDLRQDGSAARVAQKHFGLLVATWEQMHQ